MRKLRVYIASPYTNGNHNDNVRRQLEAKHILLDYGFVPFAPLDSHLGEIYKHRSEGEWLQWDLDWLEVCHILVRIKPFDSNGKEIISDGADIEERKAHEMGLLVFIFHDLLELKSWAANTNKKDLIKVFD